MDVILPLAEMSTAEKLRVVEAIWADLSRNEDQLESPSWHGQVLQERQERLESGKEQQVDWQTAKEQLRQKLK